MAIQDYEKLTPDLCPLEQVEINLEGVHLLQLKSSFNQEEVQAFVRRIGEQLHAYQVLRFLDFIPEYKASSVTENVELIEDHASQIQKDAGLPEKIDFWKFTLPIKDAINNPFGHINNGESNISVDWMLSCCFMDLTHLKRVLLVNQEDLPFKEAEGCYFGRSVLAVLIQNYIDEHKELVMRNFEILTVINDAEQAAATEFHLKKQRDISLRREQTLEHLKSLKCVKSGNTGLTILDPEFTIVAK